MLGINILTVTGIDDAAPDALEFIATIGADHRLKRPEGLGKTSLTWLPFAQVRK